MTKTEMLEILRGKILQESLKEIQSRLNEIADELEQSERVVHGHWAEKELSIPWCEDDVGIIYVCLHCEKECEWASPYCPNCGARMDEESYE